MLLEKGADVNVKTGYGSTALGLASWNGDTEIVRMLLEKGADVNAKDAKGSTALMKASLNGYTKVVSILLEKGADVNAKHNNRSTALIKASWDGHTEIVRMLLEKGADVNAKDADGSTALIKASLNGHTKVVSMLLEKGADVNAKNNAGNTAFFLANRRFLENRPEYTEIVKLLKQSIVAQTVPKVLERQEDRKNLAMAMSEKDVGNRGDGRMPYELRHEIGKYLGGGKRRTRKSNKSKRKTRKTRSKRQRGSGASCSRPTENIDIDITDEQLVLNHALGTAIVAKDPSRVKQLLDEGAHATITIDDDSGARYGMPVETIPAIMYVARHMNGSNTIILNHLLSANNNLNVEGGCAVSNMGTTLLSETAEWGNIDMMRELLNLEADINDASHRPPALSYAVLNEDLNMINFILSEREGQINLGYTHDDVRRNVIDEALELHENIESETERERISEIIETLKRYAVKQSIMSMDDFNTKCNKSEETSKVECGIMLNELTNRTAVMTHPPTSDNTAVCFDRSALQQHLNNRMENPRLRPPILTNPVTGVEISEEDIERMFPLGLDAHYTRESYTKYIPKYIRGGKSKRKTRRKNNSSHTMMKVHRKSKNSIKQGKKTRSKRQKGGGIFGKLDIFHALYLLDIELVESYLKNRNDEVSINDCLETKDELAVLLRSTTEKEYPERIWSASQKKLQKLIMTGNKVTMLDMLFMKIFNDYLADYILVDNRETHIRDRSPIQMSNIISELCVKIHEGIKLLDKYKFDFTQYNVIKPSYKNHPFYLFTYSAISYGAGLWKWRKLGGLKNKCMHDIILSLAEYGMDVNISFADEGNPLYKAIYPPFNDNDAAPTGDNEAYNAINRHVITALIKAGAMLPSDDWFENNKDKYNPHSINALNVLIERYEDIYKLDDDGINTQYKDGAKVPHWASINYYFEEEVNERKKQAKTNFLALKSHLKKLQPPPLVQEQEKGVELTTISETNPKSYNKAIPKIGPYNHGGTKRIKRKTRSKKSKRKPRKHSQSKKTKTNKKKQKVKRNTRTRKRAGANGDDSYDEGVTDRESISQDEPFHVGDIDAIPLANEVHEFHEVHDLEMANLDDSFASFESLGSLNSFNLDESDDSNVSFGSLNSFNLDESDDSNVSLG